MAEPWAEGWNPLARALRPEQDKALRNGDLSIRVNQQGKYVATRPTDGHVGLGATPRLAIEDLK